MEIHCILFAFFGVILGRAVVAAQGALFISTPADVVQCRPFTITFGGTPPFKISLWDNMGDFNLLQAYESVYGTSMTWTLSLMGPQPHFSISDSKGGTENSGIFTVKPQSGSPITCSNQATGWSRSPFTTSPLGIPSQSVTTLVSTILSSTLSERSTISIQSAGYPSSTTPIQNPSSTQISPQSSPQSASNPLGRGILIGGVLGGVGALLALIGIIWVFQRRSRLSPAVDLLDGDSLRGQNSETQRETGSKAPVVDHVSEHQDPFNPQNSAYLTTVDNSPSRVALSPYEPAERPGAKPALHSQPVARPSSPQPIEELGSISHQNNDFMSSSTSRSLPLPAGSADPLLHSTDVPNRLSARQIQTIQTLVERNVKSSVIEALVDGMLATGSTEPTRSPESHDRTRSPGPPAYRDSTSPSPDVTFQSSA